MKEHNIDCMKILFIQSILLSLLYDRNIQDNITNW
jgi:hypothetical protein